jgi:hypothetical protein
MAIGVFAAAQPALAQARSAGVVQAAGASHPSSAFWQDVRGAVAPLSSQGRAPAINPQRFRALALNRAALHGALAAAPREFSDAARQTPLVIALPDPAGGFQRFRVVDSPVMEEGLAARHPNIRTFAGRGVDDPSASLRLSLTPLGLQAAVRSQTGAWYIDTRYHLDESLYMSYWRRDVPSSRSPLSEGLLLVPQVSLERGRFHAASNVQINGVGFVPNAQVKIVVRQSGSAAARTVYATASENGTLSTSFPADPYRGTGSYEVQLSDGRSQATSTYQVVRDAEPLNFAVGDSLRSYRLALVTDPAYANYFGATNVTAAKVALINRVTQVYEDDSSIRLTLVANNDLLNLNTAAQATGTNGPCGGAACYTSSQLSGCSSSGLQRTRQVIGLLVGAQNYDVGHLALGGSGGGLASLGVVGLNNKAQGCTGINPPVGDVFAIDYVAHEIGHQFGGNHTFNGVTGSCSGGNRNAATSVEPGSGSSVMAYAGICGADNTQANSDPYWSQRSFDEVISHVSAAEFNLSEVQGAVLSGFISNGQQFQLRFGGQDSAPIVRGSNFTATGVKAAIEGIAGWPAGGTVTISTLSDNAFTVTFGGTLAGTNVANLQLLGCTGGCTGYINDVAKGGVTTRGGTALVTGNTAPQVTVAAGYTIPVRTPFALTGSASDVNGDTVTYMWEQNDRGGNTGTGLPNEVKTNGPLFRQFSKRAVFDAGVYNPPGQNFTTTDPTRVFPDMDQVLAGNSNALTGSCPNIVNPLSAANIECLSESLPTAAYVGFAGVNASPARLNMRLTARDGRGGVASADTVLTLAPEAGPFLVTAPAAAATLPGTGSTLVSWNVANTSAAPVNTSSVRILLSTDGGASWPYVLAASTANSGSRSVALPNVATTRARVKVEAIGNVFFDVSKGDFTIQLTGDVDGNGVVNCADVVIVRASMGRSTGQPGFDARADVNGDGVINVRDLAYVTQRLSAGSSCS